MANRSEESKLKEQPAKQQQQPQGERGGLAPVRRGSLAPYGWTPLHHFREEMDRMFDRFFPGWPAPGEGSRRDGWGLDVKEEDGAVLVRAEAPGFEPSDFDLQVRGGELILRAARKSEAEEKERGYHEWSQREFYRSVALPQGIDAEKVDAEYHNGVLTVKIPMTEESRPRRIQVKG
jgi:HSP20 family protein